MATLPVVNFRFSREKCRHQSRWLLNFPFREILNVIFFKWYGFCSVIAAIIWENFGTELWIAKSKGLLLIYQPDRLAQKASDVSAADWRKRNKIHRNFLNVCFYRFSRGWKFSYDTVVYVINYFLNRLLFFWLKVHFFKAVFVLAPLSILLRFFTEE